MLADYAFQEHFWLAVAIIVMVVGALFALYTIARAIKSPRWFHRDGAALVAISVMVIVAGALLTVWPTWRAGQRGADHRFARTIERNYKATIAKVTKAQWDQHHVWYTTRSGRQCDASTHDDEHYDQVLIRGTVSCNDKFDSQRGHLPGADPKVPQR